MSNGVIDTLVTRKVAILNYSGIPATEVVSYGSQRNRTARYGEGLGLIHGPNQRERIASDVPHTVTGRIMSANRNRRVRFAPLTFLTTKERIEQ